MTTDYEFWLKVIGAILTLASLGFAVLQYRQAQMWKQKEFAAAQVRRLQEDELLVLACNMMDYTIRKLPVPKALSVFTDETSFIHKQELLPAGLVVVAKDADDACNESAATFQWPLIAYRDAFDRLFTYLSEVSYHIQSGLYHVQDVEGLRYWLTLLANPPIPGGPQVYRNFWRSYGYNQVDRLLEAFKISTEKPRPNSPKGKQPTGESSDVLSNDGRVPPLEKSP